MKNNYNAHYLVYQAFNDDYYKDQYFPNTDLESLSEKELELLINFAKYTADVFY